MTDWRDADLGRTRAQDRALPDGQAPIPVRQVGRDGDWPSGDSTTWGGEATTNVTLPSGESPPVIRVVTPQIVRAQVSDNRPRVWSWFLQLEFRAVNIGELGFNIGPAPEDQPALLWDMGAGRTMIQGREELLPMFLGNFTIWNFDGNASRIIVNLRPGCLVNALAAFQAPTFTPNAYCDPRPIGETVACRFAIGIFNAQSGGDPLRIQLTARMIMTPEHANP